MNKQYDSTHIILICHHQAHKDFAATECC